MTADSIDLWLEPSTKIDLLIDWLTVFTKTVWIFYFYFFKSCSKFSRLQLMFMFSHCFSYVVIVFVCLWIYFYFVDSSFFVYCLSADQNLIDYFWIWACFFLTIWQWLSVGLDINAKPVRARYMQVSAQGDTCIGKEDP